MAEINDQDRAASARKLGITKYLPVIDSIPDPARQASVGAKNVQSDADAEAFRVGSTGVQLPAEQTVANPGLPDSITSPKPPTPNIQDPLMPAGALAFLDDVPNAPLPGDTHESSGSFLDDIPDVQTPTQAAYTAASATDADHAAKVAKLSQHFGQPPEFIDKNIAVANKAAAAPSPSFFQNMENQYPGSTKFYSDPKNMAVAHDDMPNVVATEDAVQKVTQAHSVLDELKAKWQHTLLGLMTGGKPTMTEDPSAPMWEKLSTGLPTLAAGDLPFMLAGGFAGAVGGEAAGGPPGAFLGAAAGGFGAPAAVKKGLEEAYDKGGIKNYTDLKNITEDSLKEFAKQTGVGLAVQATGGAAELGVGAAGSAVLGKAAASTSAGLAAASTAAKLATEAGALEVAGKGVEGQKPSLDGYIENLLTVGALHAVLPGHSAPLEAQKTQAAKDFYTSLGDTAEASKLRERMPEAHQALIKDLTKDGPVQNIYLPVEAATSYFQSKGLDIGTVADQLGIRPAYDEAKATGSDIKIPLDTWVARMAGEHYKGLANDVKFHPDDLTANQTTARQADMQSQVQAAATEAGNTAPLPPTTDKGEAVASALKIYQDLKTKLEAAGLSANEVQYDPKLHEAFFSTIAKRINESLPADSQIDPYELQQRFPLEVRRFNSPEDRAAQGTRLNQAAGAQNLNTTPLGYYSQLESEVGKMDFKSMPAKDLANRIGNIQGLKKEELDNLGIKDWLHGHEGKVSKDEVTKFIRDNGVKVEQKVLAENYGDKAGGADWTDAERDHSNDDDDIYSEIENNTSDKQYMDEQRQELRKELLHEHTDEKGRVDEQALHRHIENSLNDKIEQQARDYVESDDYGSARYNVKESNSGYSLYGSDESGWYSHDTGKEYGDNLEEAKIRLAADAMERGDLKGDIKSLSREEDVKWAKPTGEQPSDATINKKTKVLYAKEKDRLIQKELDAYPRSYDDENESAKDKKERLESGALDMAREEIRESYRDTANKKNTVTIRLKHPVVEGKIIGNDVKGYSLELGGDKTDDKTIPLQSKSLEDAKTEATKAMVDHGVLTGKPVAGEEGDVNAPSGNTKWEKYAVPGGKNYREVLLTLPDVGPDKFQYKTHFDEKNIVAHVRLSDRVDQAGRKTLFIEELQSDWHQQGRERGYKEAGAPERTNFVTWLKNNGKTLSEQEIKDQFNAWKSDDEMSPEIKAWRDDYAKAEENDRAVPDAPFKNTEAWAGLAFKRIIRMAAEQGYEAVGWTPGEVHVDRWGTDSVSWAKKPEGYKVSFKNPETQAHAEKTDSKLLDRVFTKSELDEFMAESSRKDTLEISHVPQHWLVGSVEQVGGRADGMNIEEAARARGKLLERRGERVATKEELKPIIAETLNRERNDRSLDSLTESVWKQMQSEDSGVKAPRKEGMEFFYDNLLPRKVAPTVLKSLDKSVKPEVGEIDTGENGPEGKQKIWEVPVTDQVKEKAMAGQTLYQGDAGNPRGQITINGRNFNIDLFKNKDKSTFLHESGHFFLEVMGHVVEGEGKGSESIKADYASVLKFLGVSDRGEIGPDQHEKFARAFEEYLSTGEAPSEGLRDAFVRFRQWLTDLWKKVSFAKVEVSPEIKAVFDRMLSADDEIKQAKRSMNMEEEFKVDGLDEETGKKIKTLQDRARARAEETLLKEKMKEVTPEFREKLAAEREKARATAEEQVKQESVFRAMDDLKEITKDPYKLAQSSLLSETSPAENAHMEAVAEQNGFLSAEDMSKQIHLAGVNGEFDTKVKAATDENLRQSGILKDHAQTREEAIRAIHSENMTELLALEREALADLAAKKEVTGEVRRKNRIIAKVEAAAANSEAERILNSKPASEAGRPQLYITQERNAAARVAKFLANKDFEKAAQAKQQQMIAHSLVRESFKISEEQAKHLSYIEHFTKRGASLLEMPYGFVRQLDQMLSRFKFQDQRGEDTKTLSTIAVKMLGEGKNENDIANATGLVENQQGQFAPESFAQFVARQNEYYYNMLFPSDVMNAVGRDYKDLSITELRDLRQSVQTLAELGRKYGRFTNEFIKIDIKEAAAKFRAAAEKNMGKGYASDYLPGEADVSGPAKLMTTLSRLPDVLNRTLDTMLTVCHKFDGQEEGPAKEFIYRPFADAESRKIVRTKQAMEETEAIFAKHYKDGEFAKYKDEQVNINGRKFTKEKILAMALNWGNEGNRDRVLRGYNYDQATVRDAFKVLGAKDWGFVQDTWDHIDKYWPEIAKLEMDVNGVEPTKVEPTPFTNEHGKFRGGYYPIAYDAEKSAEAFQNNQSKDALFKQYSTAKAATDQGHTQARVSQVKRMVRLSLDVLTNHHEDIIHDLEFRKAVIDTSRFLREGDAKTAIVNAIGIKGYAGFNDWLKSVAGGASEPTSVWDKAADWFRFKTTFFNLGYRIASAPKIALENANNMASELGVSGAARSLINYYTSGGIHDLVTEKSAFMKQRGEHLDRDMGDIMEKHRGEKGITASFRAYAFYVHAYIDQASSFPVWADVYKRGLADHGNEKLAVNQADEAVKRTFMSGGSVDQAPVMSGRGRLGGAGKAMTTAYGYQSMMWNRFSLANHEAGMAWNDGSPIKAAAIMARTAVYTFAMPAIITALTRELMRNGPPNSNQQDREKRVAGSILEESTPLKFIPIVRDMQSYAIRKGLGEHGGDLHFTPLDQAAQTLIDPMTEAISGKHGGKFGEQAANAVSLATGFPKELDDIVFNHIDWMHSHGAWNWRDAVTRKSKK